jgi:hypothetical protein
MSPPLSRRLFLALTGSALAAPRLPRAKELEVPPLLDHILLGCGDLQHGIDFVEHHTGVRAVIGGVHPGRGTQNALLSLGEREYLEIIAPDPGQPDSRYPLAGYLKQLTEPHLVGWAAHPGDLEAFAGKLREASVAFDGPTPGSRKRPDGRVLQWKTLTLNDNPDYLLPFFIEWSADTAHPSTDAPQGCRLVRFELATPDRDALTKALALLSLGAPIVKARKPQLRVKIAGPKGQVEITS